MIRSCSVLLAICVFPLGLAPPLPADEFDPVSYELSEGSMLLDECVACDRAPIEEPLQGMFALQRLPVRSRIAGNLYSLSGFDFRGVNRPEVAIGGQGSYYRRTPESVSSSLDLVVNGDLGVLLESGELTATVAWPEIDVTYKEDGTRDPLHRYTLRIHAIYAKDQSLYDLVPGELPAGTGSFFVDDCQVCERPTQLIPVGGRFLLTRTGGGGPDGRTFFRLDGLAIRSLLPDIALDVLGAGTYAEGGEIALLQKMDLVVEVNGEAGVELGSDFVPFPPGVAFPDIVIDLAHLNPQGPLHVYSLHLEAKPLPGGPPFRRGDVNGDGGVDVSDPVALLGWLFLGSEAPGCLDAADADGDGVHVLTDAVYLLDHLFRGGPAPPAPGPVACASAPVPRFGCDHSPACGLP